MDNDLYDLGAAMSYEHSILRDIYSDLGDVNCERRAAFLLPSIGDSNSVYCNTVCKPGTDYNSMDNVSDKSLIPLSMTSCLGQVLYVFPETAIFLGLCVLIIMEIWALFTSAR